MSLRFREFLDVSDPSYQTVTVTKKWKAKMKTTSTERQRKHREKMKTLDLALVQVWVPKDRVVELKSIALQMNQEGSQDSEPSPRQLAFAQFLCDKKGLILKQEDLASSKKLSEWLNKNKKKPDKIQG